MVGPIVENVVLDEGVDVAMSRFAARREDAPVMLVLPAMGIPASYYRPAGEALAAAGIHAVTADLRGIGTSSVRASRTVDFGYATIVENDLPILLRRVAELHPRSPRFLLGHSLGGHLALLAAARGVGIPLAGVALVASGTPYFRTWRGPGRYVVLGLSAIATSTARISGHYPGRHFRFGGREARTLIGDWAHVVRSGHFDLQGWTGQASPEDTLATLELPILAVSLAGDRFAPRSSMEHLLGKVPRARIERWHYEPREFGAPPADHNRWPRRPDHIVARVAEFISAKSN
jgi:predicted alpha/beta hydrolase